MSTSYEAEGTLRAIMDTQEINDRFRKREFALEIEDGAYTQTVKFQVVQDKCEMLDAFEPGQRVKLAFNLRGREFTRKSDGKTDYWTNLDCWRIEPLEQAGAGPAEAPDFSDDLPPADAYDDKDIPF